MVVGIIIIGIIFILVGYIVIQGTRASMAWRKAAQAGDVEVIRRILEDAVSVWRTGRRPKSIPPETWRGVQSMSITDVGRDFLRVSCQAESEYRMADGNWVESRNPLEEGKSITSAAAELLFYELPNYRPSRVQVDIYTSYRNPDGSTIRRCILSTVASRENARGVDWDEWTPSQIVDALGGRYRLSPTGQPLPIDVDTPRDGLTGSNGHRAAASP